MMIIKETKATKLIINSGENKKPSGEKEVTIVYYMVQLSVRFLQLQKITCTSYQFVAFGPQIQASSDKN